MYSEMMKQQQQWMILGITAVGVVAILWCFQQWRKRSVGTNTNSLSQRASGQCRHKYYTITLDDDASNNVNELSTENYASIENNSEYTGDSVDELETTSNGELVQDNNFSQQINDNIFFGCSNVSPQMLLRHRWKQHDHSCLCQGMQISDLTEIVSGSDGRRTEIVSGSDGRWTVGIQTPGNHGRRKSSASNRTALSDTDSNFASNDLVMSPLSFWNSNNSSVNESQSDRNSTSSADVVKRLNTAIGTEMFKEVISEIEGQAVSSSKNVDNSSCWKNENKMQNSSALVPEHFESSPIWTEGGQCSLHDISLIERHLNDSDCTSDYGTMNIASMLDSFTSELEYKQDFELLGSPAMSPEATHILKHGPFEAHQYDFTNIDENNQSMINSISLQFPVLLTSEQQGIDLPKVTQITVDTQTTVSQITVNVQAPASPVTVDAWTEDSPITDDALTVMSPITVDALTVESLVKDVALNIESIDEPDAHEFRAGKNIQIVNDNVDKEASEQLKYGDAGQENDRRILSQQTNDDNYLQCCIQESLTDAENSTIENANLEMQVATNIIINEISHYNLKQSSTIQENHEQCHSADEDHQVLEQSFNICTCSSGYNTQLQQPKTTSECCITVEIQDVIISNLSENQNVQTIATQNVDTNNTDGFYSNAGMEYARSMPPGKVETDQGSIDDMCNAIESENIAAALPNQTYRQNREYHRSLLEGNVKDFDKSSSANTSDDSNTFVFVGNNNILELDQNDRNYEEQGVYYDLCGSDKRYRSERESSHSRTCSSPEHLQKDNIIRSNSNNDNLSVKITDIFGKNDSLNDVHSAHIGSEEIHEIIYNDDYLDEYKRSKGIDVGSGVDLSATFTDTLDGLFQNTGIKIVDENSEPLRHRFGIDESVLPISERSVSADNIPKYMATLQDINRSWSTGMINIGVADEPESIFPPAQCVYLDENHIDVSVSLRTMSESSINFMSHRTVADIDASNSNRTSDDLDSYSSESGDNSLAIEKSINSNASSMEEVREEFVIHYSSNKGQHKKKQSEYHSDLKKDVGQDMQEEEHVRHVLETIQKLIMPKPSVVDRGMSTEGAGCVSIGIQTSVNTSANNLVFGPNEILSSASIKTLCVSNIDIHSLDSECHTHEGLSHGSRDWYTLEELMQETKILIRRLNDKLPEQGSNNSLSSFEISQQAGQFILQQWQEISTQTGQSLTELHTTGVQTEDAALCSEYILNQSVPVTYIGSTEVDNDFKTETLEHGVAKTSELVPLKTSSVACIKSSQTEIVNESNVNSVANTSAQLGKMQQVISVAYESKSSEYIHEHGKLTSNTMAEERNPECVEPVPFKMPEICIHNQDTKLIQSEDIRQDKNIEVEFKEDNEYEFNENNVVKNNADAEIELYEDTEPDNKNADNKKENIEYIDVDVNKVIEVELHEDNEDGLNKTNIVENIANTKVELYEDADTEHNEDNKVELNKDNKVENNEYIVLELNETELNDDNVVLNYADTEVKPHEDSEEKIYKYTEVEHNKDNEVEFNKDNEVKNSEDTELEINEDKEIEMNEDNMVVNSAYVEVDVNEYIEIDFNENNEIALNETNETYTSEYIEIMLNEDNDVGLNDDNEVEHNEVDENESNKINEIVSNKNNETAHNENNDEYTELGFNETKLNESNVIENNADIEVEPNEDTEENLYTDTALVHNKDNELNEDNMVMNNAYFEVDVNEDTEIELDEINEVELHETNETDNIEYIEVMLKDDNDVGLNDDNEVEHNEVNEVELNKFNDKESNKNNETELNENDDAELNADKDVELTGDNEVELDDDNEVEHKNYVEVEHNETTFTLSQSVSPQFLENEQTVKILKKTIEEGSERLTSFVKTPVMNDLGLGKTSLVAHVQAIAHSTDAYTFSIQSELRKESPSGLLPPMNSLPHTDQAYQSYMLPFTCNASPLCNKETDHISCNIEQEDNNREKGAKKQSVINCNTGPMLKTYFDCEQQQSVSPELLNHTATEITEEKLRQPSCDTKKILQQFISEGMALEYPSNPENGSWQSSHYEGHDKLTTKIPVHSTGSKNSFNFGVTDDSTQTSIEFSDISAQTETVDETNDIFATNRNNLEDNQVKDDMLKQDNSGQTDFLLTNLEENFDVDEYSKSTQEQHAAMNYNWIKFRADLEKSKEYIKECREMLNIRKGSGRSRSQLKRSDLKSQERQEQINAFKLERLREQQDYQRSHHNTPMKGHVSWKGNTPLRGNIPLYGYSPCGTPQLDRSRSSIPLYSPVCMTPREHKTHLIELRRQLINNVAKEEKLHSRSCSQECEPQTLTPPHNKCRNPSEATQGFSLTVSASSSVISDQTSSDRSLLTSVPRMSPQHGPNMSTSMEEILKRSSFSSTNSQRTRADSRSSGHLYQPLSLNVDDTTSQYSPYSAYARELIIPCERTSSNGVLRGSYELYRESHGQSDSSSIVS